MAMNSLRGLAEVLESGANQIQVDPVLGLRARLPIDRMLDFTARIAAQKAGTTARAGGIVPNIGAA
jgi:quinolinate synthase